MIDIPDRPVSIDALQRPLCGIHTGQLQPLHIPVARNELQRNLLARIPRRLLYSTLHSDRHQS